MLPERKQDAKLVSESFARDLVAVILATVLVGVYEFYWYSRFLRFALMRLSIADWAFVTSAIVGKSLVFCVLWPVIAVLLRYRLPSWFCDLVGVGTPFLFLLFFAFDVRVQAMFGQHLVFFLRSAIEEQGMDWGGDLSQFVMPLVMLLAILLLFFWAAYRLGDTRFFVAEMVPARSLGLGFAFVGMVLLVSVGFRGLSPVPLCLERLYASFPLETRFYSWASVSSKGSLAFGEEVNDRFRGLEDGLYAVTSSVEPMKIDWPKNPSFPKPNVVVFIIECLRRDALSADSMPRLEKWAGRGLQLRSHYCASNCSPLGTYALLFGRTPLSFGASIQSQHEPLLVSGLRSIGYETTLASSWQFAHRQMDRFFNDSVFDHVFIHSGDPSQWPVTDAQCVADARYRIQNSNGRPQLVVVYLNSTHFSYEYPAAYGSMDVPIPNDLSCTSFNCDSYQRFLRSLRFMDDLVGDFTDEFGNDTIIAVTGDHGESFGEDGFQCHDSRLSMPQTQTAFAMCGPNVEKRVVFTDTTHMDFLPTLVHLIAGQANAITGAHGVDLMVDREHESRMLVQESSSVWDLLLLNEKGRLLFSIDRSNHRLSVRGFADERGEVDKSLQRPASEVEFWRNEIQNVLDRWSQ